MKCEQAQKLISDRLDGKLSRWRQKRLARHLTTCELCRDYLKAQEIIQREALRTEEVDCPPEWWRQFEQTLQEKLIQSAQDEEAISVLPAGISTDIDIKEDKNNNKRGRSWTFKPHALQAASLLVVVAATLFLIIYIGRSKNEELPLPLILSYEDSYFNLSQLLAEDEEAASDLARSLEEDILQETIFFESEGEFLDIDYNYETENSSAQPEDLQVENINFEEGL
ncbi:MAG TPA: zf-HC2 domain-containing protein [Candidatus Saccharicenans sp.]|nr:zf-HC2 domain-containing protein [Candidatus Saccharicenans sp.]HPU94003.1 zf-HC2 domain-containing protein [Candidatus Saccharicenans sp.]